MIIIGALGLVLTATGCGKIGDPRPPGAVIPAPVPASADPNGCPDTDACGEKVNPADIKFIP